MDQTRAATGGAPPAPPVPRRLLEGYTPAMGVYVVFTLNAVATLEGLNDPAAIAEASALPRTQYVGLVIEDIDLTLYDEKYEKCYVSLLSQGPPLPVASEGLDEDMCVPLAPATHRKGRGSISPTPRLPWNNLYHHTTIIESVRVPSLKRDYSRSPLLSVDDVGILTLAFNDDGLRSDEMEQVYKDSHPDSQTGSREISAERLAGDDLSRKAVLSEYDSEDEDEEDDPFLPVLEYSTNIFAVKTFRSAKQFREDAAELKRIRINSEQRRQQHDATVVLGHIREGTMGDGGGNDMNDHSVHRSSAPVGSPSTGADTPTSLREASVSGQERIKIKRVPSSIFQGFVLKARLIIYTHVKSLRTWRSAGLSKDSATGHSPA